MLLAFAVDQTLERCCQVFKLARVKARIKIALWEKIRVLVEHIPVQTMEDFYCLIGGATKVSATIVLNTS